MSALPVDRCVCFDVTFAEMKSHLAERDDGASTQPNAALDILRARFGCGRGCPLCVPYIRAMLTTGRIAFAPDDPAIDSKPV